MSSPGQNSFCNWHWMGTVPYQDAWDLQKQMAGEIAAGSRPPTLLLLEHPHTYTLGRRGQRENLLWEPATLEQKGVTLHWVDRGGDITYHGPGQLVGYPLLPLAPGGLHSDAATNLRIPQADYVGYVRKLELVVIKTLAGCGIPSAQIEGLTGVWVQPDVASRSPNFAAESQGKPAKIAAIGVKVDVRGISQHGFALNIAPDMAYWDGIIGCGLKDSPSVSMADLLNDPPDIPAVIPHLIEAFGSILNYQMQEATLASR